MRVRSLTDDMATVIITVAHYTGHNNIGYHCGSYEARDMDPQSHYAGGSPHAHKIAHSGNSLRTLRTLNRNDDRGHINVYVRLVVEQVIQPH